jgi:hypothetical protein
MIPISSFVLGYRELERKAKDPIAQQEANSHLKYFFVATKIYVGERGVRNGVVAHGDIVYVRV